MMRFKKIKYKEKQVVIETERKIGEKMTKRSRYESYDEPLPSFDEALQSLIPFVLQICQLTDEYGEELEIQSVSFSYESDLEIMGATITALKTLQTANSPLVINTPYLPSEDYSDQGIMLTLPWPCVKQLDILRAEAKSYLEWSSGQYPACVDRRR